MNPLQNIKAVIFDWAGTIIDFGCVAPIRAFVEVFNNYGIEVSLDEARKPMGLHKKEHLKYLLEIENVKSQWDKKHAAEPDIDVLYQELEPAIQKVAAEYAEPVPEAKEVFDFLWENNLKIGSTTGYMRSVMDIIIPIAHKHGILPDAVVASDEVEKGRPNPDMIIKNARLLKLNELWKTVKVGDTVADIEEGLNASTWTVGVTRSGNELGLTADEIEKTNIPAIIDKIDGASQHLKDAGAHYIIEGIWGLIPVLQAIDTKIENGIKPY